MVMPGGGAITSVGNRSTAWAGRSTAATSRAVTRRVVGVMGHLVSGSTRNPAARAAGISGADSIGRAAPAPAIVESAGSDLIQKHRIPRSARFNGYEIEPSETR